MSVGKEPITAVGTTSASSTSEFSKEFKRDGVLTSIFVSTYVGHEFDLRYTFELESGGKRFNLLDPLDAEYIAGNGENHELELRREFEHGDTLYITIENNDASNEYHHNARVAVDYDGGLIGLLDELRGWF